MNFLSYFSLLSAGVLGTTCHTWLNSEELFQLLGLHSLTQHLLPCLYFHCSVASSLASVIHDWDAVPAFSLLLLPPPLLLLMPPRWMLLPPLLLLRCFFFMLHLSPADLLSSHKQARKRTFKVVVLGPILKPEQWRRASPILSCKVN